MTTPTLSPSHIKHALQSAARCDASLTSKDWLRVFWYDENWSEGTALAKYDNGAGDHVYVLFAPDGKALTKGFDHESAVSPHARDEYAVWPGLYDGVPAALFGLLQDPALEHEDVTFCCWSEDGEHWASGSARIPEHMNDGASWLLRMVQMDAQAFIAWAKSYYEEDFDSLGESAVVDLFGARASAA